MSRLAFDPSSTCLGNYSMAESASCSRLIQRGEPCVNSATNSKSKSPTIVHF
jgi:hypothetical protein